jgi:hypothetical protein
VAPTLVEVATPVPTDTSAVVFATSVVDLATPVVASPLLTPSASVADTSVADTSVTPAPVVAASPVALPATASSGLPPSTIFAPGGTTPATTSNVTSTNLAGPVNRVVDASVGGSLNLPDNSLQLMVPAGVADTDFLLVSLTEVGPTSPSANLQVGSRRFVLTVVDSGGATVTTFGTPIVVTVAGTAGSASVTALDPATGRFKTLLTNSQTGQVIASLDQLAASATTGLADTSTLSIASTSSSRGLDSVGATTGSVGTGTASAAVAPAQPQSAATTSSTSSSSGGGSSSGGSSFDPAQILRSLGLMP